MIPTVIRYQGRPDRVWLVVTVLGSGKLEARYQVYDIGPSGRTSLVTDHVWSTEADAIKEWESRH